MLDEQKQKLKDYLNSLPLSELSYIQGRYCGPNNVLLCEKQFGFGSHKLVTKTVLERIAVLMFEEIMLKPD